MRGGKGAKPQAAAGSDEMMGARWGCRYVKAMQRKRGRKRGGGMWGGGGLPEIEVGELLGGRGIPSAVGRGAGGAGVEDGADVDLFEDVIERVFFGVIRDVIFERGQSPFAGELSDADHPLGLQ